jgi:uncharacterized protein YgiM (DUF1202 family)
VRDVKGLPALFALALFLALPSSLPAAGTAYVVRSPSAGLYSAPNAGEREDTLSRGQIVTVLQKRGEWYRVITESGREGWVRESSVGAIPAGEEESMISEASPDEVREVVYYDFVAGKKKGNIRREPRIGAPVVRTAEAGEVFTIVVESGEWYQVSREGRVEGWMHSSVGRKEESRNLSLRALDLVEGKLTVFDQVKTGGASFRRAGWFPSFFLRSGERDVVIEDLPAGGTMVTVHLAYARRDIEYRTVIDTSRSFSLPDANRAFFTDLLVSLLNLSPEIRKAGLHIWFAVLEGGGSFSWQSQGSLELAAADMGRASRDEKAGPLPWEAVANSLAEEVWSREGLSLDGP